MKKTCALFFFLLAVPVSITAENADLNVQSVKLFIIERSKNSNIVCYDALLTGEGKINDELPVEAYWLLKARDGSRKDLTWLDKKAYGFKYAKDKDGSIVLTLTPYPERPVRIIAVNGTISAKIMISGRIAILERIYIASRETFTGPRVNYIELFGQDSDSKTPLYEKVIPR